MSQNTSISVVIGCILKNDSILLNKRINEEIIDIDNMWELPGGKVENDENMETAICREVLEETGYIVKPVLEIPFHFKISRRIQNKKVHVVLNCFICQVVREPENFKIEAKKVGDVKWFQFETLEYLNIIAGSREFIQWALKNFCQWNSWDSKPSSYGYIKFENVDSKQRHKKKYQLTIQFNPEESENLYCLSIQYGKIDGKITTKLSFYKDEFSMQKELAHRMTKRILHNYYIVSYENFPLKEWLSENSVYLRPSKINQQKLDFD